MPFGRRLRYVASIAGAATSLLGSGLIAPQQVAAAGEKILILGSTVTGGMSSIEATEAQAKGFGVDVVDDATWAAMTRDQFASYRAIILGDPTCAGLYSAQAAQANTAVWGPAVNGNVVILGTDPVYHNTYGSPGGGVLTRDGIDYAVDQVGKTGAYISLSCYYHGTGAHTPVPLLDGIRPRGFSVTGVGCYNNAHIVATHPAINSLSDAALSNWSCSVHEAFDSWPGDFSVLAIAKDFNSSYTASDGTQGPPYILAAGNIKSFPLSLTPLTDAAPAGGPHTVTATLLDVSTRQPVCCTHIVFQVIAGPNKGVSGTASSYSTQNDGTVSWTYEGGSTPGDDTIQAFVDLNFDGVANPGEPQTTAGMHWTAPVRHVVFVHGINANALAIQNGMGTPGGDSTHWQQLTQPLAQKYGAKNVKIFTYYQDLAYRKNNSLTNDCNPQVAVDQNTGPLYAYANKQNTKGLVDPNYCDGKGALAFSSALLDDALRTIPGPTTIFGNSMGGAITRGWMALAQDSVVRPNDPTLRTVDSVIWLQAAHQGAWIQAVHSAITGSNARFLDAVITVGGQNLAFDPKRPGVQDVGPRSPWYYSVNPKFTVPASIHYYTFYSDIRLHFVQYCLIWQCGDSGTVEIGDGVMLKGDPNPNKVTAGGGARFLIGPQPGADSHEFATRHDLTVPTLVGVSDKVTGAIAAAMLFNDPASHFQWGTSLNKDVNLIDSCIGNGPVAPVDEMLRLLDQPARGCN
jgi:hypothetical protein